MPVMLEPQPFAVLSDGRTAQLYTLTNDRGGKVRLTNFGGIVTELWMPDRNGRSADIVLGCDRLEDYLAANVYFGALIGRCGNRIAHARFTLDGREYQLAVNWHQHQMHGGNVGFDKVLWEAEPISTDHACGLRLHYLSPDGEENYPGNLDVTVDILLTDDNTLRFDYTAVTDQPTVCNLTHHEYFNLAGHAGGDVLDHQITLHADAYTPGDSLLVPTGELRDVAGTPFDLRTATRIGLHIDDDDEQLGCGGYDHNWVLRRTSPDALEFAARLQEPSSGRVMDVWTTEPGLQFYTGNMLNCPGLGKGGASYRRRSGLCLETQHFPDAVHHPNFPTVILQPGQTYRQTTDYRFYHDRDLPR